MPIKSSLLALLAEQSGSASQLQQRFLALTEEVWPLNIGQVTQTLARLERDELIEAAGQITGPTGRTAETYRLTDAGHAAVEDWWADPVLRPKSERDELVIKVSLAAARHDVDLIALLDRQRRATLRELRGLHRASRDLGATRTAERLQLERRIFDLEAEARWLDRVEALAHPTTDQEA